MTLEEFAQQIPDFNKWNYAQKTRFFGWYLQTHKNKPHFKPADVTACFKELGLDRPVNIGRLIQSMTESKPKQVLKSANGYSLERRVKEQFDTAYGERESTVAVHAMLAELPGRIPGIDERAYLNEVLTCFKHKAFRAAIVMAWNLAYDHFERWLLDDPARLAQFNTQLPLSFPKDDVKAINGVEDFSFLREDQVLTVAKKSRLISVSLHKVMKEKLDRRNAVAHPSDIVVKPVNAEDYITDLVENVVLMLN